jgi:hypothetical protein
MPLVLDWYLPFSCFCKCERSKLSKFDLPSSSQIWRWICFQMFIVLIVYVFFG